MSLKGCPSLVNNDNKTLRFISQKSYVSITSSGEDEILLNMPNAELENMRFCNLSTVSTSQVKQEFRVAFSDIDQISLLVKNIKSEIEKCPCVIKDGSRPFRVHFTSFGGKSYVISTDVRLNVPPYSDEYYDNREKVLQAIAKAANSCDVTFQ